MSNAAISSTEHLSTEISPQQISRSELASKIERKDAFALIEALPERYYRHGHLPGALLMPHDRVAELAPSLLPDPSLEVVVYCASSTCRNSDQAAAALQSLGYGSVRVYAGGKADWQSAGLPLERT